MATFRHEFLFFVVRITKFSGRCSLSYLDLIEITCHIRVTFPANVFISFLSAFDWPVVSPTLIVNYFFPFPVINTHCVSNKPNPV